MKNIIRVKIKRFFFLIQRSIRKNKTRVFIASLLAVFSPRVRLDKAESSFNSLKNDNEYTAKLKSSGYVNIPDILLPEKNLASIFKKIDGLELHDPYINLDGYTVDNIPSIAHCSFYSRESLCDIVEIIHLANDPGILQLAKDYLNVTPTISNISLWWGTYSESDPRDNELFHRDKDDYNFLKLFVYLTNTGAKDYNLVFVENSLNSIKATKKLRYSKDEIIQMFGKESIVHLTGGRGTGFFGANYSVHNGTTPVSKERKTLVLQIQYSVRGIMGEEYKAVAANKEVKRLNINPWINRLMLKL